jgi:nitrite reductase/ring-hydroxylating ferredoxin subunit
MLFLFNYFYFLLNIIYLYLMKDDRRSFLKTACAPVVLSVLGIPLAAACSNEEDENLGLPTTTPSGSDPIKIDISGSAFSNLKEVGGWLNYTAQNLLLVRVSETVIRAFNNACPHQGNRDGWSFDGSDFTCSYHNNSYSNSCEGGLQCYTTKLEGNILTIG